MLLLKSHHTDSEVNIILSARILVCLYSGWSGTLKAANRKNKVLDSQETVERQRDSGEEHPPWEQ